jgi:hypothetical protein
MDLNAVQHSHGFSRAEPLCQRLLIQTSGFQAGRGYHCVPVHRGGGRACCKKERPDDGGRVGGHGRASGLTTAFQGHRRHGSRAPPWITTAFQGHRHRITSPTTAQDGTPGVALPMDHEPHHGSRRHSKGTGTGSRAPPRLKTALQGRHCPWIMSPNMAHDGIPGAATMAHDGTTTTT